LLPVEGSGRKLGTIQEKSRLGGKVEQLPPSIPVSSSSKKNYAKLFFLIRKGWRYNLFQPDKTIYYIILIV
jgi:hypothetical protein